MKDRRLPTVLLAIGHGCVDVYQGIVPVMVPFLVAERHYDYVEVSEFVLAATVLSSVVQPLFGLLTDNWVARSTGRQLGRWLVPAGMAGAGLGVALVGVTDAYLVALLAVALSGIGVAAYHPEGARLARSVTGGDHVLMSWFSLGGNVGFALAPVIATPVLASGGLAATPLLLAPALLGVVGTVPFLVRGTVAGAARVRSARPGGKDDWPAFRLLSAILMLRSVAYVGVSAFLGLFVQQRVHGGATISAVALFVLYSGGAVGTLLGGRLAARWGRLRTIRLSYAASAVALAGVALVPGPLLLVFVAATAITLYVPFSLHITLGQDYLPNRIGTASGVTLGLAVSVGGLFAPALGALAKATSLRSMLAALVLLPVIAWLLARRLREPATLRPADQAR